VAAVLPDGRPGGFWRLKPAAVKKADLPREPAAPDWALRDGDAPLPLSAPNGLLASVAAYREADRASAPAVSPRAAVDPKATLGAGTTVARRRRSSRGRA